MGPVGVIRAALVAALAACGIDTAPPEAAHEPYRDIVDLFDRGIARTCALNNGVCHNSNNYPDLHTVANVLAAVDRPCNVEVADPELVHDACEPAADRLVAGAGAIDARIARAVSLPAEATAPALTQIALTLDRRARQVPAVTGRIRGPRAPTAVARG